MQKYNPEKDELLKEFKIKKQFISLKIALAVTAILLLFFMIFGSLGLLHKTINSDNICKFISK